MTTTTTTTTITEIWREFQEDRKYSVSNTGKFKNTETGKNLSIQGAAGWYQAVRIYVRGKGAKGILIHRAMAEAFLDKSMFPFGAKLQVNHKDGVKSNNVISNLEWVTAKQNARHAIENGLRSRRTNTSLTEEIARYLRGKGRKLKAKDLAKRYDVTPAAIYNVWNNKTWVPFG